jgi:hypothetical protein
VSAERLDLRAVDGAAPAGPPAELREYPSTDACATTGTPRFHRVCRCPTYPDNWGACSEFVLGANGPCAACDHAQSCHRTVQAVAPARTPSGPWRVVQNAGAQPQPRFVEYWEGPLPEQYGAHWVPNGFPSAEEAQAVCDALNALH